MPAVARLRATGLSLTSVRLQAALGQFGVRDCEQTGEKIKACTTKVLVKNLENQFMFQYKIV